jgi:FkbM family methyltransferase
MSDTANPPATKPGSLSLDHVLGAFAGSLDLNLRILRDFFEVRSLEVLPAEASPLRLIDDAGIAISLHLPCDNVIGRNALLNKRWEFTKTRFVQQVVQAAGRDVCLVDVGANVGLFSRQCLAAVPAISALYAYEPHPTNFALLSRNLRGIGKVRLNPVGLGAATSSMNFYLDPDNAGNYSLNIHAMPREFATLSVDILRAGDAERAWLQHDSPIFYKSDTQGFDEVIATSLSEDFWHRVRGGIFELWRIAGKEFDRDRFVAVLEGFSHKVLERNPQQNLTASDVMRYLNGADQQYDDLLFWRD